MATTLRIVQPTASAAAKRHAKQQVEKKNRNLRQVNTKAKARLNRAMINSFEKISK